MPPGKPAIVKCPYCSAWRTDGDDHSCALPTRPEPAGEEVERVARAINAAMCPSCSPFHKTDDAHQAYIRNLAQAAIAAMQPDAARVPEGWALVPIEPTEAMLAAGSEAIAIAPMDEDAQAFGEAWRPSAAAAYTAMISAGQGEETGIALDKVFAPDLYAEHATSGTAAVNLQDQPNDPA